jgi:hypothetical protein
LNAALLKRFGKMRCCDSCRLRQIAKRISGKCLNAFRSGVLDTVGGNCQRAGPVAGIARRHVNIGNVGVRSKALASVAEPTARRRV